MVAGIHDGFLLLFRILYDFYHYLQKNAPTFSHHFCVGLFRLDDHVFRLDDQVFRLGDQVFRLDDQVFRSYDKGLV